MKFNVIQKNFCLYKLDENREIPKDIYNSSFFNITKTDNELSIICDEDVNFNCGTKLNDLRLIKLFDCDGFKRKGVISSISASLTKSNISFFIVSSYEANHVLVERDVLDEALKSFISDGFEKI